VSGAEGMIGKQAVIVNRSGVLWVQLEGELWHFHAREPLQEGETVEIIGLNGLILEVIQKGK
jgi:membrane protein implicated in regulation of membrane protease activity